MDEMLRRILEEEIFNQQATLRTEIRKSYKVINSLSRREHRLLQRTIYEVLMKKARRKLNLKAEHINTMELLKDSYNNFLDDFLSLGAKFAEISVFFPYMAQHQQFVITLSQQLGKWGRKNYRFDKDSVIELLEAESNTHLYLDAHAGKLELIMGTLTLSKKGSLRKKVESALQEMVGFLGTIQGNGGHEAYKRGKNWSISCYLLVDSQSDEKIIPDILEKKILDQAYQLLTRECVTGFERVIIVVDKKKSYEAFGSIFSENYKGGCCDLSVFKKRIDEEAAEEYIAKIIRKLLYGRLNKEEVENYIRRISCKSDEKVKRHWEKIEMMIIS